MNAPARPPLTLDKRIRADIEGRIRSGEWRPGHRIPTEQALIAEYGCARMTVSKAVAALVQAGLVERRKRAGSFVAPQRVQTAVLEIPDIPALIEARGETYRFDLLNRKVRLLNCDDQDEAALALSGSVLEIDGVHRAAGEPFALEHRIVNLAEVPEAADLAFDVTPPGAWLLRHVPWTEARHRISALNADTRIAGRLGLAAGRACLSVERHTYRADAWITFTRMYFPGHRYDLVATFAPTARPG